MEYFLLWSSRTCSWPAWPFCGFFRFGSVRLLDLVLRAADVESENLVVLEFEVGYRNMLGLERILDNLGQIHSKPFKVKYFRLGSLDGIHDVIVRSLW